MVIEHFVSQFDGCTYPPGPGSNCTCATEAQWLFRASQGRIHTTACAIRRETHDTVGGTNLGQMEERSRAHGITTGRRYTPGDFSLLIDRVRTGRYGSHLNISYAPVVGSSLDAFHGGFRGNHDIYLSGPGAHYDTIRVGDPGRKAFADWPIWLLRSGAGRLDVGSGHTITGEYGSGKAYFYLTPADPATSSTLYHWVVWTKSPLTPVYSAPNVPYGHLSSGSGTARLYVINRMHWLQIIRPGSRMNGKWLHLGPTIHAHPI